jgi:hypothetical protein
MSEDEVAMSPAQKRFFASEECKEARLALQSLVDSTQHDTNSEYYRENMRRFVDRHLHYLSTHPGTKLDGYISNLKIMTGNKPRN